MHMNGNRGFTMFELIAVIAVIILFAAIAVPSYIVLADDAKKSVLLSNTRSLTSMVAACSVMFDRENWYGSWDADDDETLNNYLERLMGTTEGGHYSNSYGFENPYNGNKAILDYNQTLGSGDGKDPAVFMTANQSYAYAGKGSTKNLIGTIVVYFHLADGITTEISFYYVDKDGKKSDQVFRYGGTENDTQWEEKKKELPIEPVVASPY